MRLGRAAVIPASLKVLRELRYRGMVIGDRLIIRGLLAWAHQIQTYALQSMRLHLNRLGRTVRKVDNPSGNNRSTVIDSDHDGLPVPQIGDLYIASHRDGQRRGGHMMHLVRFTARRWFPLEVLPVP